MLIFCFNRTGFVYAQNIVIKPNPGNIILKLDASGKVNITLADVATVTGVTDPSTQVFVSPSSFDCSAIGQQMVTVTAIDGSFGTTNGPNLATFNHPFGIIRDVAGNFYITDQLGNTIRKISPQGFVSTIAGNGLPYSIDGTGTSASFEAPSGIVQDPLGNLYVTDNETGMIRKITPGGVVTTIAGNTMGFTEKDGNGTAASFYAPIGITIDPQGNLYVADQSGGRIRKIDKSYNVTTIAGNVPGYADGKGTQARFYGPAGITMDASGNLYVCDDYNRRIRKITPQGDVTTIAGSSQPGSFDGKGTSAGFDGIVGIVADNKGNLFVTESGTVSKIRKIDAQGNVTTIAGTGSSGYLDNFAALAQFNNPAGLVLDDKGDLFIADDGNNRIRELTPQGIVSTFAGTAAGVDKAGDLPVPSTGNIVQLQIPVTVANSATIVNNLAGSYNINAGSCGAVLPDYTGFINATDNCSKAAVPFTQTPLPGTALLNNVPVNVTISTTSALLNKLAVSFTVTASGGQNSPPTINISPSVDPVCQGTPVTFSARVSGGDAPFKYQWQVNGVNEGTNSPAFTTTDLKDQDIVNCAVIPAGCTAPFLGNGFVVTVMPVPVIIFNQTLVISAGESIKLDPVITGNIVSYSWSPAIGLDNTGIKSPVASPLNTTTYQLQVVSASGCDAVADVTVTVIRSVLIPNSFTPNGDGINDFWNIKNINNYAGCTVDVFNRYGQLIFHSIGYGRPWDGTANGSQLPPGAYYYIIDLKNGSGKLSGEVTIIK